MRQMVYKWDIYKEREREREREREMHHRYLDTSADPELRRIKEEAFPWELCIQGL